MLLYQMHELGRAWMAPFTYWADANARMFSAGDSWLSSIPGASRISAGNPLPHRIGTDYAKPAFGIHAVEVAGHAVPEVDTASAETPFSPLLPFKPHPGPRSSNKDTHAEPHMTGGNTRR